MLPERLVNLLFFGNRIFRKFLYYNYFEIFIIRPPLRNGYDESFVSESEPTHLLLWKTRSRAFGASPQLHGEVPPWCTNFVHNRVYDTSLPSGLGDDNIEFLLWWGRIKLFVYLLVAFLIFKKEAFFGICIKNSAENWIGVQKIKENC